MYLLRSHVAAAGIITILLQQFLLRLQGLDPVVDAVDLPGQRVRGGLILVFFDVDIFHMDACWKSEAETVRLGTGRQTFDNGLRPPGGQG